MELEQKKQERWILLGASRGLGKSFLLRCLEAEDKPEIIILSRKAPDINQAVRFLKTDFSVSDQWPSVIDHLKSLMPDRIFYFAAGGPYGNFQSKEWKDHQWALRVSFEFPALLLHHFLRDPGNLKQMLFVGSSIAEMLPDPMAASYCAAKHALCGLITSIQLESEKKFDLRLFSPGYMDTSLLPANAWPRQRTGLIRSTEEVGKMLWDWVHNGDDVNKHFVLKSPHD